MSDLIIKNLCKSFDENEIYENFNIEFSKDKINCIIGASGGGKSTLLNIIAGLSSKDSGEIIGVNNEDISYIFQEDRLISWLTIKKNMELFLYNYFTKEEGEKRLKEIFSLLHISGIEDDYPEKISKEIFNKENRLVIFVTHDVDEAIFMNGVIYVLGGKPFNIKGIFKKNLLESKQEIIKLI